MSKVLISFLGTANIDKREYRKATYRFDDGVEVESSFIANALKSYYHIDKMILIGTVKSMWEEVYRSFADELDEDYYFCLGEHCQTADHNSELYLPEIKKLNSALGEGSKALLINYGLNTSEIQQNSEIILGIEQYLSNGDELYVDITHSFRSLPLFLMNTLIYLQNVSPKKITIKHISYGMLDVSREFDNITPVVELSGIMQMNQWITGAYSFREFGNAYQISELVSDKSVSTKLTKFSDLMNLNHLDGVEKQQQELKALKNNEYDSLLPKLLISPIVNEFTSTFSCSTHSKFQLKLAKWQLNHKNYASSYLSLIEAIVTYLCELNKLDWGNYKNRQTVKEILQGKNHNRFKVTDEVIEIYKESNKFRNKIAHSIKAKQNYKTMITTLSKNIRQFEKIIK